jgi:aryl-alcohol dehydrogenase-like predicted oxidoreductase
MRYRTFGRTGWQVSEVGYGMWGLAGWTGPAATVRMAGPPRGVYTGGRAGKRARGKA